MATTATTEIRGAKSRPTTKIGWLESRHSFTFGHHYDPDNVGHGLLLVSNDDRVRGGQGFSTHPHDINHELDRGGLQPIASGRGHDAAISLRQRGAVLWGGRLGAGETVAVPDDRHVHLFVAVGDAALEGAGPLGEGDAARLIGAGSPRLTAGERGAEVLLWATA